MHSSGTRVRSAPLSNSRSFSSVSSAFRMLEFALKIWKRSASQRRVSPGRLHDRRQRAWDAGLV